MPYYKSGNLMIMAACYKNVNDDDKSHNNDQSNNNEDKVFLLLRRWVWVGHMLDHVLDCMIIGFVTTELYQKLEIKFFRPFQVLHHVK